MTTRVAVLGASGRMGKLVIAAVIDAPDLTLAAAVVRPGSSALGRSHAGVPVVPVGAGCFADADVVVDFSLPEGVDAALPHLGERALVSGTTGLDAAGEARRQAHAERGPLLVAANFSAGVNVLLALVARAAAALPEADLEVVETHHRHKRDAPSGTALALARSAASARGQALDEHAVHGRHGLAPRAAGEIGIHAVRGGDVAGEHTVLLLAEGERLALSHTASARQTFAAGAVRAARWLAGRPAGTYTMAEVLGLGGRV